MLVRMPRRGGSPRRLGAADEIRSIVSDGHALQVMDREGRVRPWITSKPADAATCDLGHVSVSGGPPDALALDASGCYFVDRSRVGRVPLASP
jgi:hypothetical protein